MQFSTQRLAQRSSQSSTISHTQTHAPMLQLLGLLVLPQKLAAWLSLILSLGSAWNDPCPFQRGKFLLPPPSFQHRVLMLPAQWNLPWFYLIIMIAILKIITAIKLSEYLPYAIYSSDCCLPPLLQIEPLARTMPFSLLSAGLTDACGMVVRKCFLFRELCPH